MDLNWISKLTALEVYLGLALVLVAIGIGAWREANRPPRSWESTARRSRIAHSDAPPRAPQRRNQAAIDLDEENGRDVSGEIG